MSRPIDLLGVPSEMGAHNGTSGGADALLGPLCSALFRAGYTVGYENIGVHRNFPKADISPRQPRGNVHRQKEVAQVADVVAMYTLLSLESGRLPVVLGGDHSISIGSGRGALEFARAHGKTIGLVWIDAHYDAHTEETTRSGNANGMPLATLLGFGPRAFRPSLQTFIPGHVIHLGAATVDCEPEEKALLDKLGVHMFSKDAMRRDPIPTWMAILALVDRCDLVWVSLDLDALDRAYAPGVHLQSDGGLERAQLLWFAGHAGLGMSGKLCGVDIMEHKPANEELDEEGRRKTARLAADFLLALLNS